MSIQIITMSHDLTPKKSKQVVYSSLAILLTSYFRVFHLCELCSTNLTRHIYRFAPRHQLTRRLQARWKWCPAFRSWHSWRPKSRWTVATAQRRPGTISGVSEISRSRMNGLQKYNSLRFLFSRGSLAFLQIKIIILCIWANHDDLTPHCLIRVQ